MRANRQFHLGLPESGILGDTSTSYVFSPVVVCERGKEEEAVQGLTVLSLTRACMAVIRCSLDAIGRAGVSEMMLRCLKEELDWRVLSHVLCQVISSLQSRISFDN